MTTDRREWKAQRVEDRRVLPGRRALDLTHRIKDSMRMADPLDDDAVRQEEREVADFWRGRGDAEDAR